MLNKSPLSVLLGLIAVLIVVIVLDGLLTQKDAAHEAALEIQRKAVVEWEKKAKVAEKERSEALAMARVATAKADSLARQRKESQRKTDALLNGRKEPVPVDTVVTIVQAERAECDTLLAAKDSVIAAHERANSAVDSVFFAWRGAIVERDRIIDLQDHVLKRTKRAQAKATVAVPLAFVAGMWLRGRL